MDMGFVQGVRRARNQQKSFWRARNQQKSFWRARNQQKSFWTEWLKQSELTPRKRQVPEHTRGENIVKLPLRLCRSWPTSNIMICGGKYACCSQCHISRAPAVKGPPTWKLAFNTVIACLIGVARGGKGAMPPQMFRKYSYFVLWKAFF